MRFADRLVHPIGRTMVPCFCLLAAACSTGDESSQVSVAAMGFGEIRGDTLTKRSYSEFIREGERVFTELRLEMENNPIDFRMQADLLEFNEGLTFRNVRDEHQQLNTPIVTLAEYGRIYTNDPDHPAYQAGQRIEMQEVVLQFQSIDLLDQRVRAQGLFRFIDYDQLQREFNYSFDIYNAALQGLSDYERPADDGGNAGGRFAASGCIRGNWQRDVCMNGAEPARFSASGGDSGNFTLTNPDCDMACAPSVFQGTYDILSESTIRLNYSRGSICGRDATPDDPATVSLSCSTNMLTVGSSTYSR